MDRKARAGTARMRLSESYTDTSRGDAVKYRYKGADRIARLRASKRQWVFTRGFL
jgi:hypothetical protein